MHVNLSTGAWIGVSLGALLVAIAGTNVFSMLEATHPSRSPASRVRLMRLHRLGGYLFVGLFCWMLYYMNSRLIGGVDDLPFPIALHAVLALAIVPLLAVKIWTARRHKNRFGLLTGLGISLFVLAFLLVSVAALPKLWAAVTVDHIPPAVSVAVAAAIAVACGTLLWRRGGRAPTGYAAAAVADTEAWPFLLRLTHVRPQTNDSKTFRFAFWGNVNPIFSFKPGQFLTFRWIVDGMPTIRSYSICSSPARSDYIEITVKRTPRGVVSNFLNERASPGLIVEARGPFGRFCFDEKEHQKAVFIAGGSGITPFLAMLRHIEDRAVKADITLVYCVRTPQDVIFEKELDEFRASLEKFRCVVVASAPDLGWRGPRGRVSREILDSAVMDPLGRAFFLCGPPGLMESCRAILGSIGVPDDLIFQESFGGKPAAPGPQEHERADVTVEFVRSRKSGTGASGRSLLEIAEKHGVAIPYSCRQGLCGTCAVPLLAGIVRMDTEEGLTREHRASRCVLTCVGRPEGVVRLDA